MSEYAANTVIGLSKGVQVHPFSDNSGCVFFDGFSAETLSIAATFEQLTLLVEQYQGMSLQERTQSPIHGLFTKHFLQPID